MLKVSNRNTRKKMSIDFENNIKNTYQLFAAGNCQEPYLGQFFLEYIPICNQKSAFSSAFKFDGL